MSNPILCSFDSIDRDNIVDILCRSSITDREYIGLKPHIDYLVKYCNDIGVKTIIVENEYIDRDFLEDYAGFYVRCFSEYHSKCCRLHLFNFNISKKQFNRLLLGRNSVQLIEKMKAPGNYLGFMVIKPLPRTVLGRTCLRVRPELEQGHFIGRSYNVNLYGIPLVAEKTIAFQEQDHVVAACATSALWSAFQCTGQVFRHHIPSPVEITKSALQRFPMSEREFPNSGLYDIQIANAIRGVGLDPIPYNFDPSARDEISKLRTVIYAYLKAGIPILLGVRLLGLPNEPGHAVAVTGFKLNPAYAPASGGSTHLMANGLKMIYAHDDGIGPYAPMELTIIDYQGKKAAAFTTDWRDQHGNPVYALPDYLFVPVYHKIRIPFASVLESVVSFDDWIKRLYGQGIHLFQNGLEWDVYLTTVSNLKTEIEGNSRLSGAYRKTILTQPMPRFIWRATARCQGSAVLDLLYDATDIDQGAFFVRVIEYDCGKQYSYVLRALSKVEAFTNWNKADPLWMVLRWFAHS